MQEPGETRRDRASRVLRTFPGSRSSRRDLLALPSSFQDRVGRPVAALVPRTPPQGYRQSAWWQRRHTGRQVLLFRFLLVATIGQLALGGRRCRGNVAVLRRRHHAPQRPPVEHQHGRAALQSWVTTLTLPVTVARFAQRHVAVGVVVAECCKQVLRSYSWTNWY